MVMETSGGRHCQAGARTSVHIVLGRTLVPDGPALITVPPQNCTFKPK